MIEFAMDYKEYFSINSLSIMNQEFSLKIFRYIAKCID